MKVVVTGASGYLGTALVPKLRQRGYELLLVGRNAAALARRFPAIDACSYEELPARASGHEVLLNLAVLNSDAAAPLETFNAVNADFAVQLAEDAARAGIKRFIYVSSFHALDDRNDHPYAVSKRAGAEQVGRLAQIRTTIVYLPAVRSERWSGRWSFLNNWPQWVQNPAAAVLSALKPVVDVEVLASRLDTVLRADAPSTEVLISNGQAANPFYQGVRRLLDLVAGLAILLLLWWLLLGLWIAVRLGSEGPGLFAQERVGREGRPFICYKFRTMHVGTRQVATHEMTASAVTSTGHFLRRTKLDELPQCINLLKGEMTLVGPRPCLPSQTKLIELRRDAGVLALTPGITGLAQVNGVDMSVPEELVVLDRRYLDMQGLLLDLRLLIGTVTGKGAGDRVRA